MAIKKFSAYTLGTACIFSLFSFDTSTQAVSLRIQTPDIKVVQYIDDLPSTPLPLECIRGVEDTIGGVAAGLICTALDVSQNPEPPTSFTEQSWEDFKASKEYRGYIQIPSFTVFSDGQNIVSYTQFEQESNPGFTPIILGDLPPPNIFVPDSRIYGPAEAYPDNGSSISQLGSNSLTVENFVATRLIREERLGQFLLTGYDAPFAYARLEEVIPADGSPIEITVRRSEFPSTKLYIDNELVSQRDQVSDLSDFFISGGRGFNPSGEGNFAPAGDSISILASPEIDSVGVVGSGTISGTFDTIEPEPGSFDLIEGRGTSKIVFQLLGELPNSFTFEAASFDEPEIGETIVLGTLSYENGIARTFNTNPLPPFGVPSPIFSPSSDTIYTSNLTISSNSPILTPFDFNQSLTELLTLIVTANTGTPEQNADTLFFSSFPEFGSFRVLEGETGSVELLGSFGSLNLTGFGSVVSGSGTGFVDPTPVPESSSVLGTIAFILGGSLLLKYKPKN